MIVSGDPLPPAGVIQIVTAWPFFSMPECIIEWDGTLIVDAAKRVETLWPESNGSGPLFAGDHTQHPLELAPGGWFESHYSPTTNRPGEHGKGRYTITRRKLDAAAAKCGQFGRLWDD